MRWIYAAYKRLYGNLIFGNVFRVVPSIQKNMGTLLIDKFLKLSLYTLCYPAFGYVILDRGVKGAIADELNINNELQIIILWVALIFWVLQLLWFIIDKYIQIKERLQKMDFEEDDHEINKKNKE